MTRDELNELIVHPEKLDRDTLPEIYRLLQAYPYAQTIVFLYLYNLALVQDVRFYSELQKWAVALPDREKLYFMVELNIPYKDLLSGTEEAQNNAFELIERFLDEMKGEGGEFPNELLFGGEGNSAGDYFSSTEEEFTHKLNKEQEELPVLIPQKREDAKLQASRSDKSPDKQQELDIQTSDTGLGQSLFTETLARIYIKQGRYDKAHRIIENLSLKFPEKSIYFADQLRFLERLIENDNI